MCQDPHEEEGHRDLRALPPALEELSLALGDLSIRSAVVAGLAESLVDLLMDPSLRKLKRLLRSYRRAAS